MKGKEKSTLDKIIDAIVISCSACVVILALLQLFGVWKNAQLVYMPLTGANMVLVAFSYGKKNKRMAVFNLLAAAVMLLCFLVISFCV